ncbi:2Fe-2S iron-sulfur cluster-binding protein [Streptomyces sp. AM 2-1-1]|uniref:2Fe-2S iron-sulfur cluster-binding protein n=1 Tax=Streptomyces sp. AM 2-1-1 TaxID=3028709 RepID=UPI0023B9E4E1|nr:2Fe-2S iron-sulfur cluster-binding protein [Streptomyces sp. AM 2-1-1]WEH41592.1 2Fe-2S iron-sulfur cluster-binding protein [Streptomyces sp. AM 2-1-1]
MSNEEPRGRQGRQGDYEPEYDAEPQYGSWQPTRQSGEYDADATAFVHLPPEDLADVPLAAPGHGYVPPMILPLTPAAGHDPAAGGGWNARPQPGHDGQPGAVHWPDPNQQSPYPSYEQSAGHHTEQWNFVDERDRPDGPDAPAPSGYGADPGYGTRPAHDGYPPYTAPQAYEPPYGSERGDRGTHDARGSHDAHDARDTRGTQEHPGDGNHTGHVDLTGHIDLTGHVDLSGQAEPAGHTGQWTIPVADGELPDESGEFAASSPIDQWYTGATPPATLPGGAAAPWATQEYAEAEPETAAEPETPPDREADAELPPEQPVDAGDDSGSATADEGPALPPEVPDTREVADVLDTSDTAPGQDGPPAEAATADAAEVEADAETGTEDATGHGEAGGELPDAPEEYAAEESAPSTFAPEESAPEDDAAGALPAAEEPAPRASEHPSVSYLLHVNGVDRPVADAWIGESLLYVLRERLGLAGAKDGCSQGECGACNVQVDGRLVASCLVPAATTAGSEVRTVEGLAVDGEPSDVQRALAACGAVQCGFCIPGMAMTVHDLLEGNHAPSELQTRQALCGNLCRCSGYRGVLDAVRDVVASRAASAEAAAVPPTAAPEATEARIPHQAPPGAGGVQAPPHEGDAR